ncbi:MAG TPA: hypothetical protein VF795_05865 [Desulfuromonadaceae bacterium]
MKTHLVTATTLLAIGLIAGCGGGSSTPASTVPVTGKVADGYLAGATVFMDKNGNYQLDPGEPSTTTDANGNFTLTVDPADVGQHPIVALAMAGKTIDMDTNTALANSYVLSMPAASVTASASGAVSGTVGNFISPVSSQLRIMMDSGNYASVQNAMDALRTQMGLPAGTNMLADYMATNNTAMHTAAQNMATLMGSQMSQVMATSGTATTVDVGRYQGMMVAIFQNMSSIKGSTPNSTAMTNLMSTMTATLQNSVSGLPFRNISSSIRGMMGSTGSSTLGVMMGVKNSATSAGTTAGTGMMGSL